MATPNGTRAKTFPVNATDAVHVYSGPSAIWLQLRRDCPTEVNIDTTSFKTALRITPLQAIAIAGELLTVAAAQQETKATATAPSVPSPKVHSPPTPENHGKPWTSEEDEQLVSRFRSRLTLAEIAKKHKRGIGGIQSRLVKRGIDVISFLQQETSRSEQKNEPNGLPRGA
ncbi:MAG: hypothetical protein ACAI35_13450 [Candidatus Methylacidiphilales bacterium]|nr:hypothetical protein [Candidatus Methylacidiphilales bacterium]